MLARLIDWCVPASAMDWGQLTVTPDDPQAADIERWRKIWTDLLYPAMGRDA